MPENHPAAIRLKERFAASVLDVREFRGEVSLLVRKEDITGLCGFLKDDLGYNFLTDITAVDYLGEEPRFMMVYHLCSMPGRERLRLKAPVAGSDPSIDSLVPLWKTANWLEREVFDLFGITFKGHPDLRRILLPNDWNGHPLRKDYPLQGPDREPYKGRLS
jgi:NADH-quinone oxidoreductase subunit C